MHTTPINSGPTRFDTATGCYVSEDGHRVDAPANRQRFVYKNKVVGIGKEGCWKQGRSVPWSGVVTFSAVPFSASDYYVLRGGIVAGYISPEPDIYGYDFGWTLRDNSGNLIDFGIDRKGVQRFAISHLPSAAEQVAYREEHPVVPAVAVPFAEAAE